MTVKLSKKLLSLLYLLVIVNVLDVLSTHVLLGLGGLLNPLHSDFKVFGVTPFAVFIKIGAVIAYCFLVCWGFKRASSENVKLGLGMFYGKLGVGMFYGISVFLLSYYLAVVINNSYWILEALRFA